VARLRPPPTRVKSAQNSIGPRTCWQQIGPSDRPGRSPRTSKAGPGTDPHRSGRKTFATLVAPALKHRPAGACAHAGPEPVSLLAFSLVGLVRPFHVSSLITLAPQTPQARGHAVKTVRRATSGSAPGHALKNPPEKGAKYTSPLSPRQSRSWPISAMGDLGRWGHALGHERSGDFSDTGSACVDPCASSTSRHRRTQAAGDTVENIGSQLLFARASSACLWNQPHIDPLPAHAIGPSTPSSMSRSRTIPRYPRRPRLDAARETARVASPGVPVALLTPHRKRVHSPSMARLSFLMLPAPHERTAECSPLPLCAPPAATLGRLGPRDLLKVALLALGEIDFPHFQQKSWSMRPSGFSFLHFFHTCGHTCG